MQLIEVYDMDSGAEQPHWLAECTDDNFAEEAMKAAKAYIDRWEKKKEKIRETFNYKDDLWFKCDIIRLQNWYVSFFAL